MGNLCPQLLRKNIPICNILQMNLSSVNLEKISHWHGGNMASFLHTQLLDPQLYGGGFVNPAGNVWDYAQESDLSWYVTSATTDTTPSSNFSLCVLDSKCFWSKYILTLYLFIYLGFNVAFNTVRVISRRVVGRAEETSTYSSLGLCTVNCRPTASNNQLSHLSPCGDRTLASEVGGECYHSATMAPTYTIILMYIERSLPNNWGTSFLSKCTLLSGIAH